MTSKENENAVELPEGDVGVPTEDLPRSDQFLDSSETKCPQCDKMLTKEEIDKHMKIAHEYLPSRGDK
jgi:acetyl-CoA carboxylase beta subunit